MYAKAKPSLFDTLLLKPVRMKDNAWIGEGSKALKGLTIGEASIVGAGSLVTRDVPPSTIVAGNPAKAIREVPRGDQ